MFFFMLICFCTFSTANAEFSIKIGTCNLWNVMFNWKIRTERIADIIRENDLDIVAFQEVRLTESANSRSAVSQLDTFTAILPEYKWIVSKAAGPVTKLKDAYHHEWEKEGLGILSRKQIVSSAVLNLTKTGSPDKNYRIALHVRIRIGSSPQDFVNVIVVHFSYDRNQQCQNAGDIMKIVTDEQLQNVIILGDFNTYTDFTGPVDLFTSKRSSACVSSRHAGHGTGMGTFKDAWLASGKQSVEGLTFSNMPTPGLQSRPDRILVSRSITVEDVGRTGDGTEYKKYLNTSVIISRAKSIVRTSLDAFQGRTGYSCLHDCGPHGSCRCGICVSGGNQLNCNIPDCQECSSFKFFLFAALVIPFGLGIFTFFFSVLKILVVSANFSQDDIWDILGYRCCLFNQQLFQFRVVPRRYKTRLAKLFCLCQLPPALLLLMMLISVIVLLLLFKLIFRDSIDIVYSILPEELFPSDHLIVHTKLVL